MLVGGVLGIFRDAVSVFDSTSRLGHSLGEFYPSAEMQSLYSATPADCADCAILDLFWFDFVRLMAYKPVEEQRQ